MSTIKVGPDEWDRRFLATAAFFSTWSKDPSTKVGCVIVDSERGILSTGFNGFPRGIEDTEERLNNRELKYQIVCHAEQNAILQAAYHGVSIQGSVLFCTNFPCVICSKMLINAGIRQIFYLEGYPDSLSETMLNESGMELHRIEMEDDT